MDNKTLIMDLAPSAAREPRLDSRLLAYAAAAGAVVAGGQAAQAVVESRAIGVTVNGANPTYDLDVDDDGAFDFTFSSFGGGNSSVVAFAGTTNGVAAVTIDPVIIDPVAKALRLTGSSYVPGSLAFSSGPADIVKDDTVFATYWAGQSGYLGLQFDISGATHYGFADMTVGSDATIEIHSVSWETQANTPIHIPAGSVALVPEPVGLGALAMGAAGLAALRRRRVA
ncbi:MAG: PEP-CTERM sorting domain-containing protein [Phycisphaeraceae bacterium]